MITMNEDRVVCFIEDNLHNRLHKLSGDFHFLGSWHINDLMLDLIALEETLEFGIKVFLD